MRRYLTKQFHSYPVFTASLCRLLLAAAALLPHAAMAQGDEAAAAVERGRALLFNTPWPQSSGIAPYRPFQSLITRLANLPGTAPMLESLGLGNLSGGIDRVYERFGLGPWPSSASVGPYRLPFPAGEQPDFPVGGGVNPSVAGAQLFAPSCAGCHARRLFGRVVLGAPNHLQRMRDFSMLLKSMTEKVSPLLFRVLGNPTEAEAEAYEQARDRLRFVQGLPAPAPGMDTEIQSLLNTLTLRGSDPYAVASDETLAHGRTAAIPQIASAVIKAGTWWTLRYRNRSYADGMAKGQPLIPAMTVVFLSGGVDLKDMETWLREDGGRRLNDMTAAVYATEAPAWLDFFPEDTVSLPLAKQGQHVFDEHCARCHGHYTKAWDGAADDTAALAALVKTTSVQYHADTPRLNVGTDPGRADSVATVGSLLGALAPLQDYGVTITAKPGAYVPQPLVGIWARWPYFHNGSAATLCDVLTPAALRTPSFYLGPAEDTATDYDTTCVGTPRGDATPAAWRQQENLVDTSLPGLSRQGHDEGIFLQDGAPLLSDADRAALIMFLKLL